MKLDIDYCPFCGEIKRLEVDNSGGIYWVVCRNCQAVGSEADTPRKAVKRWNKRVEHGQEY